MSYKALIPEAERIRKNANELYTKLLERVKDNRRGCFSFSDHIVLQDLIIEGTTANGNTFLFKF